VSRIVPGSDAVRRRRHSMGGAGRAAAAPPAPSPPAADTARSTERLTTRAAPGQSMARKNMSDQHEWLRSILTGVRSTSVGPAAAPGGGRIPPDQRSGVRGGRGGAPSSSFPPAWGEGEGRAGGGSSNIQPFPGCDRTEPRTWSARVWKASSRYARASADDAASDGIRGWGGGGDGDGDDGFDVVFVVEVVVVEVIVAVAVVVVVVVEVVVVDGAFVVARRGASPGGAASASTPPSWSPRLAATAFAAIVVVVVVVVVVVAIVVVTRPGDDE
jgi:hypothetical protein